MTQQSPSDPVWFPVRNDSTSAEGEHINCQHKRAAHWEGYWAISHDGITHPGARRYVHDDDATECDAPFPTPTITTNVSLGAASPTPKEGE